MYFITFVGGTGSGKTTLCNRFLGNTGQVTQLRAVRNKIMFSPDRKSPRRQYVFDINYEYDLPLDDNVNPLDPRTYLPAMRHIDGDRKRFLDIALNLKNTNIVFEDATGFVRGQIPRDLSKIITRKMHLGNNVIFIYHALRQIPPDIMAASDYLFVCQNTGDNIDEINTRFKKPKVTEAFLQVQRMPVTKFPNISHVIVEPKKA